VTQATPTEFKSRPILFAAPLVRAILDGRKTQTRRLIQPQPRRAREARDLLAGPCRWGEVGDRLWVRERWAYRQQLLKAMTKPAGAIVYAADEDPSLPRAHAAWRSSYQMPRSACRIELEIVSRRLDRLQHISPDDALAEGYDARAHRQLFNDPRQWFAGLWDSFTPRDGCAWADDPWVWVLTFRRV
jgi:hypothetical protein